MEKGNVKILGLSFYYHDSSAALIVDGVVISAMQEERFSRKKHDESFPINSINFCLENSGLSISDIDYIVFYDKPLLKFERLLETYIKSWPKGFKSFVKAMQVWLKKKIWVENEIRKTLGYKGEILFTEHHYAHAAGAYYSSDFNDSVVVTLDGVGEFDTTTIGYGSGSDLIISKTLEFPNSLGLLYSAFTYYLGFKVNDGEYKVMGLAPYGDSKKYYDQVSKLVKYKPDGSFDLNMEYFSFPHSLYMTNSKFNNLFGGSPRKEGEQLTQKEKDIAASLQVVLEDLVLSIVKYAKKEYPSKNLCLSGGVALNCVSNGNILKSKIFDNIYVPSEPGDAGSSVGAALYVYYSVLKNKKEKNAMPSVYLGTEYSNEEIEIFLEDEAQGIIGGKKINYKYIPDFELYDSVAKLIVGSNAVGWFQGRMEFGSRALGNRSIIADPRNEDNWEKINKKIKFRESFRPFAPTVLYEHVSEYFDLKTESPFMSFVVNVKNNTIPAVTHVNKTARAQTIKRDYNHKYYDLVKAFYDLTGCPVVVNTSFNVQDEPIVESLSDAFNCFVNTDMDYLVLGNYLVSKQANEHGSKNI